MKASTPAVPSSQPVRQGSVGQDSLQKDIASILKIPPGLIIHQRAVDLCLAYAKYHGYLKAQAEMQRMIVEGSWPLKTLTSDELIEVFVSKSIWQAIASFFQQPRLTHSSRSGWR